MEVKTRILFYDIETTTNNIEKFDTYREGHPFEENRSWHVVSISCKWSDEKETIVKTLADFPRFKKDELDDKFLIRWFHKEYGKAEITCAHNGDRFDNKRINTRFAYHGLDPVTPGKSVDTLKALKKYFSLNSNSLDYACQYFGIGEKYKGEDIPYYTLDKKALWSGVLKGELEAFKIMAHYNKIDVIQLEKLYLFLEKWIWLTPSKWDSGRECPKCGSTKTQKRGFKIRNNKKYTHHQCQDCAEIDTKNSWFFGDLIVKKVKV